MKFLSLNEAIFELQDVCDQITIADIYDHRCERLVLKLGDNCTQNFHLGRYIVGYMVGNLVLRRRVSGAVIRDFRTYIRRYSSPNENFEYGYPNSNALLTFFFFKKTVKMYYVAPMPSGYQLHKTARQLHHFYFLITCQQMKNDVT